MEKQEILEAIREAYRLGVHHGITHEMGCYESADEAEDDYLKLYERMKEELS